jgi:iron complex outermembrane recepter protein
MTVLCDVVITISLRLLLPRDHREWPLTFAVRADRIDGRFTQFNAAGVGTTREVLEFGTIVQPKFNLSAALTDHITFFANAGRSFQHPFGADTFTLGSTNARDVSHNVGLESGIQWAPSDDVELRLSLWQQNATKAKPRSSVTSFAASPTTRLHSASLSP